MKTFLAWMEKHRDGIEVVVTAISTVVWFISLFVVRTAAGAGAILVYFFFNASPDTTVYQLSQLAHLPVFWQGALCIAMIYSGLLMVIHGSSSGGRVVVARSVGQCAMQYKETARSPHPKGGEIITYAQGKDANSTTGEI